MMPKGLLRLVPMHLDNQPPTGSKPAGGFDQYVIRVDLMRGRGDTRVRPNRLIMISQEGLNGGHED